VTEGVAEGVAEGRSGVTGADPGTARFNALTADAAERALRQCCAARAWVAAMAAGRPYPDRDALLAAGARQLAALSWMDVREAIDVHPRIGDRATGDDREAAWSRREQSGMDDASAETRAALLAANRAYEDRFGHVFLIFASGRSDVEMLAAARERLGNDEATERAVVRAELGRIVALRLERTVDS
jgi:2-oxo-4-hydroxy-4-carboxy-5-ureidoimidazoline decarboxylase